MSKHPPIFNERDALIRSSTGDSRAFKLIFDHYNSRVYTFALKYLKSTQQAEEATQEIFLKLWEKGESLSDIVDLDNYIFTISRNHSFDQLRRMKIRSKLMVALPNHDDYTNETEETIMLHDTRRILEEAIVQLPPQQKRVYQLCHQQGLKYEQAAAQMNLSAQTVHRHMKLALRFLRNYLKQHTELGILIVFLKLF
ncbi:RNA polymerase sigma factor [Parapedobacter tibetensis]|uniref:RNA polymerase sigma factor n=1 Tax=Parapedobacter tibetensis TaxID=2972951 RepID=UPI00214D20FB|nr:RNA polymerase sigma-70 factor [Parapedobacter tibetensis]